MRLVLGLDIGITSVGYAIIDIDSNNLIDYGVRLFKEGTAENNIIRRSKRGSRRLKRRKANRINDMKKLLIDYQIMDENYCSFNNPYELRVKGLKEKLDNQELTCALLHLTKNRGSSLDVIEENETNDTKGSKDILKNNNHLLNQGKYVCEIQLERLQNNGKIRGITNNFKTTDYIKETKQILSNQSLTEEQCNKIIEIIQRKRTYYEGPGSEKSPTPYGRYIELGIQPIDLIEKMRGKCSLFPDESRAPKLSYTAELFNLLNDLNNLIIDNEKITYAQKKEIINFVDEKGNITIKQLLKILNVSEDNISGFRINKNNKPILTEFKGYKSLKKILDKYNEFLYKDDKKVIDDIAEILTKKKGVQERKDALKEMYASFEDDLVEELSMVKGMTKYHSLSFKAMRLLNEELLKTEMNQMQIIHANGLFNKFKKSTKGQKNIYADEEVILSPVVKRAQKETFKVINALRKKYGEFGSIIVETTRDKNTQEQKKNINDRQKFYENQNKEVDELLKVNGYNSAHINAKTKLKIRLYLQQDCKTAYTLQTIDINRLINDPNAYEIEHIIPISVSLDDSINNKVLASRIENQQKGKMTPIEAFLKGKFVDIGGDINKYKLTIKSNKKINKKKKEYLLFEKDITKFDTIKEFIARNLVDTSYTNRVIMNTLSQYFKDNDIDTKVHTIRGSATNMFRKRINLPKDREQDYLHHAVDALIVASIKKLNLLNTYLGKYNIDDLYNSETGEIYPVGDDKEILDPQYIQFITDIRTVYEESYKYYNGLIDRNKMQFKPIKISHKIDTKPNRQIADETIYSTRKVGVEEKVVKKHSDIYAPNFAKLTNDVIQGNDKNYLMYHHDRQTYNIIKSIILDHFELYKNDRNVYSTKTEKGKLIYSLKGKNNPLYLFKEEHGKIRKYSKKGNGPEITIMKYYDGKLGNHIPITQNYESHNKNVVLLQISPYRTDFYQSPEGKYKFVTIRYSNVFFKKSIDKYVINKQWYNDQKVKKGIDDNWKFVCSLHHDELIGVQKQDDKKYVYDLSTENNGVARKYHGEMEILKFTATNDDLKNKIEVKPIYTYCKKQIMISTTTLIKIEKYATDILGNLYKVKDNVLKLEFD